MRGRVLCQASASFAGAQGEVQPEGAFEIFEEVRVEDVHLVLLYRLQVRLYLNDVEIPLFKRNPTLIVGRGAGVKSTLRFDMRPFPSAGNHTLDFAGEIFLGSTVGLTAVVAVLLIVEASRRPADGI